MFWVDPTGAVALHQADCLDVLRRMPEGRVDAIVTDPPYGLKFMGKRWDHDVPGVDVWQECLRVLKPGGHLLCFAGTRTHHRMCCAIEDAGFEIRDMIAWVYGSGFPKSHNIGKAIDKAAGAEREVVGKSFNGGGPAASGYGNNWHLQKDGSGCIQITAPATPEAAQWEGWGTALKPAMEPVTVARKPFAVTVAANVLEHGTGAINIDGCRVAAVSRPLIESKSEQRVSAFGNGLNGSRYAGTTDQGRWPANIIHDGSQEVTGLFPQESARFFYCAKASKKDRGEGNKHPTVKPTNLMRYLCRLVTPICGVVLDPFMGSGSTGKAAILEGFQFLGVELEEQYFEIAKARVRAALES